MLARLNRNRRPPTARGAAGSWASHAEAVQRFGFPGPATARPDSSRMPCRWHYALQRQGGGIRRRAAEIHLLSRRVPMPTGPRCLTRSDVPSLYQIRNDRIVKLFARIRLNRLNFLVIGRRPALPFFMRRYPVGLRDTSVCHATYGIYCLRALFLGSAASVSNQGWGGERVASTLAGQVGVGVGATLLASGRFQAGRFAASAGIS
jgi:hypothetical protein